MRFSKPIRGIRLSKFKRVGEYWSVRVGDHYRAVAVDVEKGLLWIWIGSHAEYDGFIRS